MTPPALKALMDGEKGNFMAASLPGGIERQEAEGQKILIAHADHLPIKGTIDDPVKRQQWETVGFVFGEPIPEPTQRGLAVFVACTFPKGWSPRATGHSMWSEVLDDKGRNRARVFFKAAFYDYNAHTFGLEARYRWGSEMSDGDRYPMRFGITDAGRLIHVLKEFATREEYYASDSDTERLEARMWLKKRFPDHENPMAYWE